MRSDIAISVRNLTKTYRVFGHPTDRIKQALTLGRMRFHREFTALHDISFEIRKGETVGIVGRNGSGKSTLLQLICGILKPTSGTVQANGRVSALLELGAGFNPEFTGRENVYFQGAIMGIPKNEMDAKFNDIAAFADIGEFIDQPVRTYSSGMYVRLAFAVSVSVEPDILVVDEALAVGDASFRSRCFRRVAQLREKGCTILFVSHALDQIIHVCSRSILLDEGELLALGNSELVAGHYQRLLGASPDARYTIRKELRMTRMAHDSEESAIPGTEGAGDVAAKESYDPSIYSALPYSYEQNGALIESVRILTADGLRVNRLLSGETYRCTYTVRFLQNASQVRFAMLIRTPDSMSLGGAWSALSSATGIPSISQGSIANVEFEFRCVLNPGSYMLCVSVAGSTANIEYTLHGIRDAEAFSVISKLQHAAIASVDFDCRAAIRLAESVAS